MLKRAGHSSALDGVRGIAILMVLSCHLSFQGDIVGSSWLMHLVQKVMFAGWAGVDLFFVLSGFLITGILLDTSRAANRWASFYARRALRIFPLYYFAIIAAFLAAPLFPILMPLYPSPTGWFSYVAYFQNWYMPLKEPTHVILGQFWSLGVEEQFYFVWPACVWFFPRTRLVMTCAMGCVIALTVRCIMTWFHASSDLLLMTTVTRMDALLCGAFCAICVRDSELFSRVRRAVPYVIGIAIVGMFFIKVVVHDPGTRGPYMMSVGFTLIAAVFGAFVLFAYESTGRWNAALSFAPLRLFGKYSYGIYVYHGIIFFVFNETFRTRGWLFSAVMVLVSLLTAMLSFHLFENQFLRLKSRFAATRLLSAPRENASRSSLSRSEDAAPDFNIGQVSIKK